MIDAIFAFLIGIVIGIVVLYFGAHWYLNYKIKQTKRELEVFKELADMFVDVKLEMHHGIFYMFRADNDAFIAQGSTYNELRDIANLRIPEKAMIRVTQGDDDVIAKLKDTKVQPN